jgi:hypothetical protein
MAEITWKYEDGVYAADKPIYVASLDGSFEMWFDVRFDVEEER